MKRVNFILIAAVWSLLVACGGEPREAADSSPSPTPAASTPSPIADSPSSLPEATESPEPKLGAWPYEGYPRLVAKGTLPLWMRQEVEAAKMIAVAPGVWQEYKGGQVMLEARAGFATLWGRCAAVQEYMRFQQETLGTVPFGTVAC